MLNFEKHNIGTRLILRKKNENQMEIKLKKTEMSSETGATKSIKDVMKNLTGH